MSVYLRKVGSLLKENLRGISGGDVGKVKSSIGVREQITNILDDLRREGYQIDDIVIDGEFHHFKLDAHTSKKAGSYCVQRTPFGYRVIITNFKDPGRNRTYELKDSKITPEESVLLEKQLQDDKAKRERKITMQHETIANEAWARFNLGTDNPKHPYLIRKGLKGSYGAREHLGSLMIPMKDVEGKFWGYQSIPAQAERKKETLKGARYKGLFHLIGEILDDSTLYVAEGFATAATIYETLGSPSICSFGTPNFKAVATSLRLKYPNHKMIIMGDADASGEKSAKAAAYAANALYQIPQFAIPAPGYTDFNDLRDYEGEGTVKMQLQDEGRAVRPKNDKQAFIEEWLVKREAAVSYTGAVSIQNQEADVELIKAQIYLDGMGDNLVIPERLLNSFLTIWIESKRKEQFEKIKSPILQYYPNDELRKLIEAFLKNPNENDQLVFKHFIWQTKRKLAGLNVEHHMMPVIAGKHRSGKTETIRKLLDPLGKLWIGGDFAFFEDERKFFEFNRRFVMFFDEMDRAEKTDIAAIKRMISEREFNFRRLHTHTTEERLMNCTFIATTNDRLKNLVKDPFSMRRFYEVTSLDKADFKAINSIDFLKIWQGVSEKEPCPVLEHIDSIDTHQEKSRHLTDIEYWTKEWGMEKSERAIALKALHTLYRQYAEDTGSTPCSSKHLSDSLQRLGFEKSRGSTGVQFYIKYTTAT